MGNGLKASIKNLYGLPSFGFQVFVNLEVFFFAVFLTDYALLPLTLVGTVMAVTGAFDIIWVPVAGIILEKTNMKWGKYRSWLLVGPPFAVLFYMFQFAKIGTPIVNAIVITLGFAISHLIWNIFYTAHLALNNSMTVVREERVYMASNRGMFNALGAILFSLVATPFLSTAESPATFTMTALIAGAVLLFGYYTLFILTKGHELHGSITTAEQKQKMPVGEMLNNIIVNPPLMGMLFGDLGRYIGRFVIFGLAAYYVRFVVADMAVLTALFTLLNVALFAGAAMAAPVAKKIGERNTYILSLLIFIVGLLTVYLVDLTPTAFLAVMFFTYLGYGMPDAVGVAMYSNTVDYGEWKTGKNVRGFVMSLFSLPIKTAILLRGIIIAGVLAAGSYVPDMAVTDELLNALRTGFTLIPVGFLVFSLIIVAALYRITPESLAQMQKEVAERKANS